MSPWRWLLVRACILSGWGVLWVSRQTTRLASFLARRAERWLGGVR